MLDTDLKDNYNSSQHHIGKGYHTDAYYINNKYAQFCNYQDHINFLDTYY